MSSIDWKRLGGEPDDGTPFLVFLAAPFGGSRIHAAKSNRTSNGNILTVVAGKFSFDLPSILRWAPMINEPDDLTSEEL